MTFNGFLEELARADLAGDLADMGAISLSRMLHHVQEAGEKSFAFLTSQRSSRTPAENRRNWRELVRLVNEAGYPYTYITGYWWESEPASRPEQSVLCPHPRPAEPAEKSLAPGEKRLVKESSLFIMGIKRDEAILFGCRYGQEAILYGGPETEGQPTFISLDTGKESRAGVFHGGRKGDWGWSETRGRPFYFGDLALEDIPGFPLWGPGCQAEAGLYEAIKRKIARG